MRYGNSLMKKTIKTKFNYSSTSNSNQSTNTFIARTNKQTLPRCTSCAQKEKKIHNIAFFLTEFGWLLQWLHLSLLCHYANKCDRFVNSKIDKYGTIKVIYAILAKKNKISMMNDKSHFTVFTGIVWFHCEMVERMFYNCKRNVIKLNEISMMSAPINWLNSICLIHVECFQIRISYFQHVISFWIWPTDHSPEMFSILLKTYF